MVNSTALDSTFRALADPIRRSVLERLAHGEASVSALAVGFDISLPAFLKHIHVLEDAGLLSTRKVGRIRQCRQSEEQLIAAESWLREHRAFWERQLTQLDEYFKATNPKENEAWPAQPNRARTRSNSNASSQRARSKSTKRGRTRKS